MSDKQEILAYARYIVIDKVENVFIIHSSKVSKDVYDRVGPNSEYGPNT